MSVFNVTCPRCGGRAHLKADRLPDDRAMQFPCPSCKQTMTADKRKLQERADGASVAGGTVAVAVDRRFPKLPADARFPSGIILGEDDKGIAEVQSMLAALGSETERVASAAEAREIIINEQPELCVYVAGTVSAPPFQPMEPLTGLPSSFRRRLYLVLIASNLKTLDGNAAFLYEVNMIIARQDFPHFGAALHAGLEYHERLYKSYFEAVEARGTL